MWENALVQRLRKGEGRWVSKNERGNTKVTQRFPERMRCEGLLECTS